jgi:RNA polymerase sigma-70 factor (ECF subfamily)
MHETANLTPDLLLRHEAFVLRLARSLVRDEAGARDVAQETLLAALKHAPEPGSLRGWLARVVRHRASDLRRGERRRSEREASVARAEAQPPASSAAERLELEHGVVRAVLALDEPYRGVVVAVYYEGLAPAELARRNGVAPGTVRAQLSRALEKLRAKLDREHGDRATWGLALVGLLHAREGVAPVTGAASASGTLVSAPLLAASGLAGAATLALGAWWMLQRQEAGVPISIAAVQSADPAIPLGTDAPPTRVEVMEREDARPSDVAEQSGTTDAAVLQELARLLERARQIRSVVVERRLEVDPGLASRYAWLLAQPDSGIVRLVEDTPELFPEELRWVKTESSKFSFRARVHGARRHPQIELYSRRLRSGIQSDNEGFVLDLGDGVFGGMSFQPELALAGLEPSLAAAVEHLRGAVRDGEAVDSEWLPRRMAELGFKDSADLRVGHGYLLRSVSEDGGDVLVALEAVEVGNRECTLAWRMLEHRPWSAPYQTWKKFDSSTVAVDHPVELVQRLDEDLLRELVALQIRGEELLLQDIPQVVLKRYAHLANRTDAGLARLVDRESPWMELPRPREGGAFWSFVQRSHDYNRDPDLGLARGIFSSGFVVLRFGMVVDLGECPMPSTLESLQALPSSRAIELALTATIDRQQALDEVDARVKELSSLRSELVPYHSVKARVGHSYLVRSMLPEHDVLAVFEVVELDELGALIAWRILRTLPVAQAD